ncbi:MAG TPA: metallopeptidase TldD-related protein [Candidatus Obscuribacterales bacterium]
MNDRKIVRAIVFPAILGLLVLASAHASAHAAACAEAHAPVGAGDAKGMGKEESLVMIALKKEMQRTITKLKNAGDAPLYFLAYRVYEKEGYAASGELGALKDPAYKTLSRTLDVEVRVGSPKLDNTHKVPDASEFATSDVSFGFDVALPVEDDEAAIRNIVWLKTDAALKAAQKRYSYVKANKELLVPEEDRSDDFALEKAQKYAGKKHALAVDPLKLEKTVRDLSRLFKDYHFLRNSSVDYYASRMRRYLVTSDGTAVEDGDVGYEIRMYADTVADDGMVLWLYDEAHAKDPSELPDRDKLAAMAKRMAVSLEKLRKAPPAQPFVGPAILRGKAAAVFFHEIFGHRVEGHRQKDESEGRTFADKINTQIMPRFVSVLDDPTAERLNKKLLNGYYRYDDEGVPAQKVVLVDHGILKRFLMSRSPIRGFKNSNGHGRCRGGHAPVARQANLMVVTDAAKQVPTNELKELLRKEIRRQKKPYGLIFDEIEGGSTFTTTSEAQIYNLYPLRVTRVFADGRPDELLRGVDIVGTPLASLENILSSGNDMETFNGSCGAESGWVPVSASSPSLLVKTIEVARQAKSHDKPPLLPDPLTLPKHSTPSADTQGGKR